MSITMSSDATRKYEPIIEPLLSNNIIPISAKIPGEIIDFIIDHLHTDQLSLFACSLTCRTWLPSTRYHLFSRVILRGRNIASFSELLEYPLNNIAFVVQLLAIWPFDLADSNFPNIGATVVLPILPSLTAHLHSVKSLSLSRMDWTWCSVEILRDTLSNLGGVDALELDTVIVRGLAEAVEILCAFPLLKSISLDSLIWDRHDSDHSPAIARHQQRPTFFINFIDLTSGLDNGLMEWLFNPTPTIHTIRCRSRAENWTCRTLASAGASLRMMEINLDVSFNATHLMTLPLIDITKCTSLRSILFHQITIFPYANFGVTDQVFVPSILEQVSSPLFELLSLRFKKVYLPVNEWNAYFDWKKVADILLQPQFANLKRVYIEWPLSPHLRESDVESFFANGPFSPITERGLVQLEFYTENPDSSYYY